MTAIAAAPVAKAQTQLVIRTVRSLDDLRSKEVALTALHAMSARRSPFSAPSFIINYAEHDEHGRTGDEILVLIASEGAQVIAYLPLRVRHERTLGVSHTKVEPLVTHDGDRPHVVSAPSDEVRCAGAFLRYLTSTRWDFVELMEQDATSPFFAAARDLDSGRFYVRHFTGEPVAVIVNRYASLPHYYGAMSKKFRQNLRRGARELFALDNVEYIASRKGQGPALLLESYLDMESASWKARAAVSICRHPERLTFFRRMVGAPAPFQISVELLLHRGRPIAGLINGAYGGALYALQIAYDARYERVSPGAMLLLLAMKRVIDEGMAFYDLLHGSTYYKTRWLAELMHTESVQIYRRGSVPHVKARLGDMRRALHDSFGTRAKGLLFNTLKRAVRDHRGRSTDDLDVATSPLPDDVFSAHTVSRLATPNLTQMTGAEMVAHLPFAL